MWCLWIEICIQIEWDVSDWDNFDQLVPRFEQTKNLHSLTWHCPLCCADSRVITGRHCTAALKLYRDRAEHTGLCCRSAVQWSLAWSTASFWASCCVFNWVDEMQSGWHDSCFLAVQCCQLFLLPVLLFQLKSVMLNTICQIPKSKTKWQSTINFTEF